MMVATMIVASPKAGRHTTPPFFLFHQSSCRPNPTGSSRMGQSVKPLALCYCRTAAPLVSPSRAPRPSRPSHPPIRRRRRRRRAGRRSTTNTPVQDGHPSSPGPSPTSTRNVRLFVGQCPSQSRKGDRKETAPRYLYPRGYSHRPYAITVSCGLGSKSTRASSLAPREPKGR